MNLALHLIAGLSLFWVLRHLLKLPTLERYARNASGLALAVSLVWLVHPLLTQSVTYVVQRSESLMGMLFLLLIYCVIRGSQSPLSSRWYVAAVLCFFAGMWTKEVMIAAPPMAFLIDGILLTGSFSESWRRRRAVYLGMLAPILMVLAWWLLAWCLLGNYNKLDHFRGDYDISRLGYLLSQMSVLQYYLALSVWPSSLCFDYAWPMSRGWEESVPPGLLVGSLLGATAWALWRRRPVGLLGAWFFLILAPTSSVLPIRDLLVEHRMYLPLISVVALLVIGAWELLAARLVTDRLRRLTAHALLGLTTLGLGYLTAERNTVYRSGITLWSDVVAKRPLNARAHNNLGYYLAQQGDLEGAIVKYEDALRVRPDYPEAYGNLGKAWQSLGDTVKAVALYEQAIAVEAGYAEGYNNIGLILASRGDLERAEASYLEALRIQPDYAEAHANLGVVNVLRGDLVGAEQRFATALHNDPLQADAHNNLASILVSRDRVAEAIPHYEQALESRPDYLDANINLGIALLQLGRAEHAVERLRAALQIDPQSARAHFQLGEAYVQLGRLELADQHFHQTLRLAPGSETARSRIERLELQHQRIESEGAATDVLQP